MLTFLTVTTALAIVASAGAVTSHAQEAPPTDLALQQFQQRVDGYMALRHRIERSVPPLEVSPDPERILEAVDALAAALRAARSGSEAGEIFTADVQLVFRIVIRETLRDQHYDIDELLADLNEEVPPGAERPPLVINGRFPWAFGAATPPCLLAVLPALPGELQYRFVGRDLVLVDINANLVVDILSNALPPSDSPTGCMTPGSACVTEARNR